MSNPVGPTCLRELDASVGASGPHDFAVRSNISRQRAVDRSQVFRPALRSPRAQNAAASTASRPAFVTIMIRPSVGWDGGINKSVSIKWRSRIFLQRGLDTRINKLPVGQITRLSCSARGAKIPGFLLVLQNGPSGNRTFLTCRSRRTTPAVRAKADMTWR